MKRMKKVISLLMSICIIGSMNLSALFVQANGTPTFSSDINNNKSYIKEEEVSEITNSNILYAGSDIPWDQSSTFVEGGYLLVDKALDGTNGTMEVPLAVTDSNDQEKIYSKGIGSHAHCDIIFNLDKEYRTFSVDVGMAYDTRNLGEEYGVADIKIYTTINGQEIMHDFGTMMSSNPYQHIELDMTGVSKIRLVGENGTEPWADRINWCDAKFTLEESQPENSAYLSDLTLSTGTLSPSFSKYVKNYIAAVENNVNSITITPSVEENENASIKINGKALEDDNTSGEISLNVGENLVIIEVTAEDGSTVETYTIVVTRSSSTGAAPAITPESWGFDLDEAKQSGLLTYETYEDPITGQTIKYWFHAPTDYKTKEYPVLMFMHGHGDGGSDTDTNIKNHVGIIYQLLNEENQRDNPCIIVAPQTPETHDKWVDVPAWGVTGWNMDTTPRTVLLNTVYDLYNEVQLKYNADMDRAYITGLSMGGFATWDLITRNPGKFAAAAPICGAGDPSLASLLRKMPIWTFHGTKDDVVPVGSTRAMYNELEKYGNIQYTEYPDEKHSSWNSVYGKENVQNLIDWMFAQNRKNQEEPDQPLSEVINVAQGCKVTATGGGDNNRPFNMAVDGVIGTSSASANYGEFGTNDGMNKQSRYMQFELNNQYDVQKIKMWRYWDDSRRYDNTVIALSDDEDFTPGKPVIVYNSDKDNKHGFGAGSDQSYAESNAGFEIMLDTPVTARYIRVYMYGNSTGGGSNHIVEFQAFAEKDIMPAPNVTDEMKKLQDLIDGDVPVQWGFAGDSITHACYWTDYYKGYSEYFSQRLKSENIRGKVRTDDIIINQGISGATTTYFTSDFNSWVDTKLDLQYPSVMFVAFGMNDKVQNNSFTKPLSVVQFKQNLNMIVDKIREAGGIPILQTPNPVKPTGNYYGCAERRPILDEYANAIRSVAADKGVILIDINQYWKNELSLGTDVFGEWMPQEDGIHPNSFGHLVWAKYLFEQLNIYDENSSVCSMGKEDIDLSNDDENIHPNEMVLDCEKLIPSREYKPELEFNVDKYFTGNQLMDQSEEIGTLKKLQEGTIVARFKTSDGMGSQAIFSADNKTKQGNNNNEQLVLGVNDLGRLYYYLANGNQSLYMNSGDLVISDGRWHTVIVTNEPNQIKMYVDGRKVTLNNTGTEYQNNQFAAGLKGLDSLTIGGAVRDSQSGEADWFYHGNVSYIDVYSQIFTEKEAVERSEENVDSYALQIRDKVNEQARNPWVFIGGETSIENQTHPSARNFIDHFQEVYRYEFANENRMHGFFVNQSISGKPLKYYVDNYDSTIKRFKPAFVVITPDIFDRDLVVVESSQEEFRNQLDTLLARLKDDKIVTILQSPAMVGEKEKNKELGQYVKQMTQAAEGKDIIYINNYAYFNSIANNNAKVSGLWLNDGKFPNETGQLEIARKLLAAIYYNIPEDSRIRTLTYSKGAENEQENLKPEAEVTGESEVTLDVSSIKKNSSYVFEQFNVYLNTEKLAQVSAKDDTIKVISPIKGDILLNLEGIVRLKDGRIKTVAFESVTINISSKPDVDKSVLKTLINRAEVMDISKYTDASKTIFANALNEARKVYTNADVTQDAVDKALKTLENSIKGLVLKPEKITLIYKTDSHGKIIGNTVQTLDKGTLGNRVEAVADPGYKFYQWSDGVTQASRIDKANRYTIYTAFFVKTEETSPQKPIAKSVKLNEKKLSIGVKEKVKLKATVLPAGASQKVVWTSDHKSVATVSKKGEILGKKKGVARIKAKTVNGKYITCKVYVRKAPEKVTIKAKEKTLKVGQKFRLKVTLPKKTASYRFTYTTSNKKIAVVSPKGVITAKKRGVVNIKVKTFNKKEDNIKIIVKK